MVTLKDIVKATLYQIDEDVQDTDEEILQVVKNGINEGYFFIASNLDQRTKDVTFPYTKAFNLPSDFVSIINISHSAIGDLSIMDYEIKANLLYIRAEDAKNDYITLKYVYSPSRVNYDNDIIELKEFYVQALIVYAAYSYYVYRKKTEVAAMFLAQFKLLTGKE